MTDSGDMIHTWSKHSNRLASIKARMMAIAYKLGQDASTHDYKHLVDNGSQPFGKQNETL